MYWKSELNLGFAVEHSSVRRLLQFRTQHSARGRGRDRGQVSGGFNAGRTVRFGRSSPGTVPQPKFANHLKILFMIIKMRICRYRFASSFLTVEIGSRRADFNIAMPSEGNRAMRYVVDAIIRSSACSALSRSSSNSALKASNLLT